MKDKKYHHEEHEEHEGKKMIINNTDPGMFTD